MADRFAYLYEQQAHPVDSDCLRFLEPLGIVVAEPETGCVTLLDAEGEPQCVGRAEFDRRLASGSDVSLRLMLAKELGPYCRLRRVGDISIMELGLEGLSEQERVDLGVALCARLRSAQATALGLVFDPEGETVDYPWHDFFLTGQTLDGRQLGRYAPTALIVRKSDFSRVTNLPSSLMVREWDSWVIIARDLTWYALVAERE